MIARGKYYPNTAKGIRQGAIAENVMGKTLAKAAAPSPARIVGSTLKTVGKDVYKAASKGAVLGAKAVGKALKKLK